ncbi:RCC1 domain-containing protein [Planctomycetota bacterium]
MKRIEQLALCMLLLGIAFIAMGPACPMSTDEEKNYYASNTTSGSSGNTTISPTLFSMVGGGQWYTVAIATDGTLWLSGNSARATTGGGALYGLTQVGPDSDWQAIACGRWFVLALKTDGTLWAWGWNQNGQLGVGDTLHRYAPAQVGTDTDWVEIVAGMAHSLARKSDGTLWAWGWNNNGQLGLGDNTDVWTPTQVGTDSTWTAIAGGFYHTLAISTTGSTHQLWACGNNTDAELGLGYTSTSATTFTRVGTGTNWSKIASGNCAMHNLAIKDDGTLWGWGYNSDYDLGLGHNTSPITETTQIGTDTDWAEAGVGCLYGLALKTNGTVWAWGPNESGQCGQGDFVTPVTTPKQVGFSTNWASIGDGYDTSYAILSDGTAWGWGYGATWELATGDYRINYNATTPCLLRVSE